jgi:hypothetical protein
MRRGVILSLVVLLAVVASSAAGATTDPKQLVLRLGDMPTGFGAKSRKYVPITAGVGGGATLADYKRWGYLNGYEADFTQQGSVSDLLSGAGEIASSASVYKTATGARASLANSSAACTAKNHCERLQLAEKIGDKATLFKSTSKSSGTTTVVYAVLWVRGSLKASVFAAGVGVGPSVSAVVKLAQTQDRRMAATH